MIPHPPTARNDTIPTPPHLLATPSILAGKPARNWWAVTPGFRRETDLESVVTRGELLREMRRLWEAVNRD